MTGNELLALLQQLPPEKLAEDVAVTVGDDLQGLLHFLPAPMQTQQVSLALATFHLKVWGRRDAQTGEFLSNSPGEHTLVEVKLGRVAPAEGVC